LPFTLSRYSDTEVRDRVLGRKKMLGLTTVLDRKPAELSGDNGSGWRWAVPGASRDRVEL
jgi:ABC-type sugar transport system ATPase subunit